MKPRTSFVTGFLTGSVFFSGIALAATNISVDYLPIKFMVDGRLKETNDAFIYKGTPYAPVNFVAQQSGKQVQWNAASKTITIGGEVTPPVSAQRLSLLTLSSPSFGYNYAKVTDNWKNGSFSTSGITFDHGLGYDEIDEVANDRYNYTRQSFDYDLGGKYARLTGVVAVDDNSPNKTDQLIWRVKGDGKVLFDSMKLKAGQSQQIDINIKGVKKLSLEMRRVTGKEKKNIHAFIGNALLF